MIQRADIARALLSVEGIGREIIKAISIDGGRVNVTLAEVGDEPARRNMQAAVVAALEALDGVEDARVHFAAAAAQRSPTGPIELPNIRNIIAVGAGKGGVGKSTIAVHLALGLERTGAKVGLLDADVYGPSVATMTGIEGAAPETAGPNRILPFRCGGIEVISMANFADPDTPMIWRGPMVHGVVRQFLGDVEWGELDYMVIDLPPGTGDVPLTLAQSVPVTGAVVVSTPQPVALDDAVRAARMYQHLGIAVLGLVENMSYFVCEQCGAEHDIFGRGGVKEAADQMGFNFLGEIPMTADLRANTDSAKAAENFSGGPVAAAMESLVAALLDALQRRGQSEPSPKVLGTK